MRILLAIIIVAIFALPCGADEYEYVPGTYETEDAVQGLVKATMTVAQMKARWFTLKAEKEYQQELVANAISERDGAIASGQAAQAKIAEINSEMAALKAAYEAWLEAANVPAPTE